MTRTFLRLLKATSQAALVTLALVPRPAPAPPILYEADLDIVSFEVSSAPETVQIGELFEITLQKVVKNNGDDGPRPCENWKFRATCPQMAFPGILGAVWRHVLSIYLIGPFISSDTDFAPKRL